MASASDERSETGSSGTRTPRVASTRRVLRPPEVQILDVDLNDATNASPFRSFANLKQSYAITPRMASISAPGLRKLIAAMPCYLDTHYPEKRRVFVCVLEALAHPLTLVGDQLTNADLLTHAQNALAIDDRTRRECADEVRSAGTPEVPLTLEVVLLTAKGLAAKDANGLSDPYCTLELVEKGKKSTLRHKQRDLHSAKIVGNPAIRVSTVKHETLDPKWNETFTFDLPLHTQGLELHVDLWDYDEHPNEGHGGRRIRNLAKYVEWMFPGKHHDYLGNVIIPVSEIQSSGIERSYELLGRSEGSHVSGTVELRMQLKSRQTLSPARASLGHLRAHPLPPDAPAPAPAPDSDSSGTRGLAAMATAGAGEEKDSERWGVFLSYVGLLEACVRFDVSARSEHDTEYWAGEISDKSRQLLYQYSLVVGISDPEQVLARWLVFSSVFLRSGMSAAPLLAQFEALLPFLTTPQNAFIEDELQELNNSLTNVLRSVQDRVVLLHQRFTPDDAGVRQLTGLLRLISHFPEVPSWRSTQPADFAVASAIAKPLHHACLGFFHEQKNERFVSGSDTIKCARELVTAVATDLTGTLVAFRDAFAAVDVDVLSEAAQTYCPLLATTLKECLSSYVQQRGGREDDLHMLQLLMCVGSLVGRLRQGCDTRAIDALEISKFHDWFAQPVLAWLASVRTAATGWVRQFVDADTFTAVATAGTVAAQVSESSVFANKMIYDIFEGWDGLHWPPQQALTQDILLVLAECVSVTYSEYALAVQQRLTALTPSRQALVVPAPASSPAPSRPVSMISIAPPPAATPQADTVSIHSAGSRAAVGVSAGAGAGVGVSASEKRASMFGGVKDEMESKRKDKGDGGSGSSEGEGALDAVVQRLCIGLNDLAFSRNYVKDLERSVLAQTAACLSATGNRQPVSQTGVAGALSQGLHCLTTATKGLIELLAAYHAAVFSAPDQVDHWALLLSGPGSARDTQRHVTTCLDLINSQLDALSPVLNSDSFSAFLHALWTELCKELRLVVLGYHGPMTRLTRSQFDTITTFLNELKELFAQDENVTVADLQERPEHVWAARLMELSYSATPEALRVAYFAEKSRAILSRERLGKVCLVLSNQDGNLVFSKMEAQGLPEPSRDHGFFIKVKVPTSEQSFKTPTVAKTTSPSFEGKFELPAATSPVIHFRVFQATGLLSSDILIGEFYLVPSAGPTGHRVERELHACAHTETSNDVLELMRLRSGEDKALAELVKTETKLLEKKSRNASPAGSPQMPRRSMPAPAPAAGLPRGSAASLQVPPGPGGHSHA